MRAVRTRRAVRGVRTGVVLLAALAVLLAGAPHAQADTNLDAQKRQLDKQIAQTKKDLNESSHGLLDAVAALQRSQLDLKAAQTKLAATEKALAAAKKKDAAMAAKLKGAQTDLAAANAAVAKGKRQIAAQKKKVGQVVGTQVQQKTNLLGLAVFTQTGTTRDLSNRVQWSTTLFDASQQAMDTLTALQTKLVKDQAKKTAIEQQVAADRKTAAANLVTTKALEQQAAKEKQAVAAEVVKNTAAKGSAAKAVATAKQQYADQMAERDSVERKIQARIAAEKKAAAAKAKREAAAKKRAAAKRKASQRAAKTSRSTSRPHRSSSAHHGFIYPVNGPITSPYGMRMNPVVHRYELHTGTDFGVGCGTPIRAPYPGVVTEKYSQVAYGNRLFIDHGKVDGTYVTTVMNHATHYIVGVGQHVKQGQVVGYVGETGWATGCHLHLMVFLNGKMVNPMSWY